jgi:hypothetical protein
VDYTIPLVDTTIDTDEPVESLKNFGTGVLALVSFTGMVAAATFAYRRVKAAAGVEGETVDVGGV